MIIISDIIFDHVSVLQSNISLNDITFQMNERSSFCSLLQLVWNVWWSQCRSHRANFFTPVHNKLVHKTHTAGRLQGVKPCWTFIWVDNTVQVCQNPTHAPEGKKVKFDLRLCGDAMVAHLKREIPEIMATRWVRQFSTNMVYILSAPHQLRPYNGKHENGD